MVRRAVYLTFILIAVASCDSEKDDFLWEHKAGAGRAYFIESLADSGFVNGGTLNGKAYFMLNERSGKKIFDYSSQYNGAYSSVINDTAYHLLAGADGSQLLLTRLDKEGNMVWEKLIEAGGSVGNAVIMRDGDATFTVLCGPNADSLNLSTSVVSLIQIDTAGSELGRTTRTYSGFFSVADARPVSGGNYVTAVTKAFPGGKSNGSVVLLNGSLQHLWERELSTNPSYAAASLSVSPGENNGYIVSGKNELAFEGEVLVNSYVAAVSSSGVMLWKRYPENSNEGVAVMRDDNGLVFLLNKNCFIVNQLYGADGLEAGRIRTYMACDSYDTDAKAEAFAFRYDGSLLLAGAKAGNYYLAIKPVPDI